MHTVESSLTAIRMHSRLNSTSVHISSQPNTHDHGLKHRNNDWGPKKFEKKNHVIKLMVCCVVCVFVCMCVCVYVYCVFAIDHITYLTGGPQKNPTTSASSGCRTS